MGLITQHLDANPDDAMVIMDESVFFLDIVQVAISKSFSANGDKSIFRYDGRVSTDEREAVLGRFNTATGPRFLLASRGTGCQGLNLQSANVLIRCGPWLRVSWEQQAQGRIYRFGQGKPTFVYELSDKCCKFDKCLRTVRDRKDRVINRILDAITYDDDRHEPSERDFV